MGNDQHVLNNCRVYTAYCGVAFGIILLLFYGDSTLLTLNKLSRTVQGSDSFAKPLEFRPVSVKQQQEDDTRNCAGDIRLRHIEEVCERWKTTRHVRYQDPGTYWALLVDDKHKLLYCIIPKSACTSFQHMIVNNTGRLSDPDEMAVHDPGILKELDFKYLNQYSFEEIIWRLEHYFKFIAVRHPFDRLYSAYKDKVESHPTFMITKYGWLEAIRRHFPQYNPETTKLAWEQFVELLATEYDTNYKDRHWALYDEICHPCDIKYNYVIKLETLSQDLPGLLSQFAANGGPVPTLPKLHVTKHGNAGRVTYQTLMRSVKPDLLRRLYSLYQKDFELFGYAWDNFTEDPCATRRDLKHCC